MKRILHAFNLNTAPWLVLTCSLVITFLLWRAEESMVNQQADARFQQATQEIESAIFERLRKYELMLRGCIGLFHSSDVVDRNEWKIYVQSLDPLNNYPGIQGIGFARRVAAAEKQAHISRLRAEGFPEYTIKPAGDRAEYFPIIYLEPFSGRNLRAFSYDMFSEQVRREAMQQARDRGVTFISGKVTLVQETARDIQHGFLMYLPLYEKNMPLTTVQQRRDALLGFVYSPFRVNDFMEGLIRDDPEAIAWEVYDGTVADSGTILYRSHKAGNSSGGLSPLFQKKAALELFGRTWTLHFKTLPAFEKTVNRRNLFFVVSVGLLVSILLYAITALVIARSKMLAAEVERRAREQEALSASEQRFRTLAEEMPHFVWEADADGLPLYANKRLYEYTGLTLERSQADGWIAALHPDDVAKVDKAWREALTVCLDYDLESRFREAATGAFRWFRIKGNPVRDPAGRIFRWVGTCTDIHEQKQAGEALKRSELRLRRFYESGLIGVSYWNMEGLVTDANDKFLEMVGYSREDLLAGRINWISMTPPEYRDIDKRSRAELKAGGADIMPFEKEYIRRDGSRIPVIVAGAMLDEERFNGVSFALDITVLKNTEMELRQKTLQLEEANRELETYSYSVSHDLQAPLRAISGSAGQILKNKAAAFDEATLKRFTAITDNAKKMEQLIKDLLNLSRIGEKALDIAPVNMAELAGDVWKQLKLINPDRAMWLDIREMPVARGDMMFIFLVYLNLLGNALKFTKHCSVACIEVGGFADGTENTYYVRDNGIGFDRADYENIFGVFQRLHNPQEYEGSGIGLAIVQRIIHKHGGRVWAKGNVGKGATFYFTLPRN